MPFFLSVATNSLVNLVSQSCITIEGFSFRFAVCSMNASVCSVAQHEFGRVVEDETITSRVIMHRKAIGYRLRMPRAITAFTEKKLTAHCVSPCRLTKLS